MSSVGVECLEVLALGQPSLSDASQAAPSQPRHAPTLITHSLRRPPKSRRHTQPFAMITVRLNLCTFTHTHK
ncbi:hypothetical protein E2C01_052886 [Portunus trituberculatus]|uniref:Uncharacterized protein n=1 Tax=Portunus trituberculatus TaxID=210409 RepID=A0A5B7GN05_PORTR|nr:hypothetical protein [Portunus trituberculatus]